MLKGRTILKIGLISPGMYEYWSQMPGIKQEIEGYGKIIADRLGKFGEVYYTGVVDSVSLAREARDIFKKNGVDIMFIHCGTYAPSKLLLAAIYDLNIPFISLHLQPVRGFSKDSHPGCTMPKNTFSCGGEVGNILTRAGACFDVIVGQLNDNKVWKEIEEWCSSVYIKKALSYTNIAWIGNYLPGMCDIYTDMAKMIYTFGVNIEILEAANLAECVHSVTQEEVLKNFIYTKKTFTFIDDVEEEQLKWCNQVAVGLEKLVKKYDLSAIAFNINGYPGSFEEKIGYSMTLGGSLLSAKGIPCLAEGDILLTIPSLVMGYLSGGATQSEICLADYESNLNYVGHSGPGDFSVAQDDPCLRWLPFFHGKKGSGVSCEFSIKHGPVSLVSLVQTSESKYKILIAEGEVLPGQRLQNGSVNSRIKFSSGIEEFFSNWVKEGPSHHSTLCPGHYSSALSKFSKVFNIETKQV